MFGNWAEAKFEIAIAIVIEFVIVAPADLLGATFGNLENLEEHEQPHPGHIGRE